MVFRIHSAQLAGTDCTPTATLQSYTGCVIVPPKA